MVKFCPECGVKLEKDFKFCPECGYNLGKTGHHKKFEKPDYENEDSKQLVEVIICENCGEENDPSAEVCSSCGVKLVGRKEVRDYKSLGDDVELKSTSKKPQVKPAKQSRDKKNPPKPVNKADAAKKLNAAKFITIGAVGVGLAFVILLFSGILNPVVVPSAEAVLLSSRLIQVST